VRAVRGGAGGGASSGPAAAVRRRAGRAMRIRLCWDHTRASRRGSSCFGFGNRQRDSRTRESTNTANLRKRTDSTRSFMRAKAGTPGRTARLNLSSLRPQLCSDEGSQDPKLASWINPLMTSSDVHCSWLCSAGVIATGGDHARRGGTVRGSTQLQRQTHSRCGARCRRCHGAIVEAKTNPDKLNPSAGSSIRCVDGSAGFPKNRAAG